MTGARAAGYARIQLMETIGEREYGEICGLQEMCLEHGRTALKLELDGKLAGAGGPAGAIGSINEFLYYDGDVLIGYLGICGFGGGTLELNSMTHPGYRRRGVFSRLFSLAADECRRSAARRVLLLCDRNSEDGQRFVRKTGAVPHHTELEMVLKQGAPADASACALALRRAVPSDAPEIARLDAACDGLPPDPEDSPALEDMERDGSAVYMAEAGSVTVGKVRLETRGGCGGIYGLCVRPDFRGRGYGRGILMRAIEKLREGGAGPVRLQVDESNGPARHIYEKAGFEPVYTMDYFELKV